MKSKAIGTHSNVELEYFSEATELYALHIAEDDGEVDLDFPALDSREPIAKFDFARLALVERIIPRRHMSSIVVTMYALAAPAHPLAPITKCGEQSMRE